jgi:undecaprenyl-phosphate alpha-N-acetylglucosaminyl 1-phosphatetransferase
MFRDTLISSLIAILASLFCYWLLIPVAGKIGLVDRPNSRKWHQDEVPLIGGIGVFFGFCLGVLNLHVSLAPFRGVLAAALILVLMGVVDDLKDLSARLRLVGQVTVALVLVISGGALLEFFGDFLWLGPLHLGLWSLPLSVFLIVAYMNALNMLDGQDGLAAGVALVQCLCLIFYADQMGQDVLLMLLIILAVLLSLFLLFNVRLPGRLQALIFMGDAGSTFLAFILGFAGLKLAQVNPLILRPIDVLWVLSLPFFDLVSVMIYRALTGVSVFKAGRDHGHHILANLGLSVNHSTLLLCFLSCVFALMGYLFWIFKLNENMSLIVWVLTLVSYVSACQILRQSRLPEGRIV